MRFRLTPRSMTLNDLELLAYKFEFSWNFAVFRRFGKSVTAKQIKIDDMLSATDCSPLNKHKTHFQVKLSPLNRCMAKSADRHSVECNSRE